MVAPLRCTKDKRGRTIRPREKKKEERRRKGGEEKERRRKVRGREKGVREGETEGLRKEESIV